MALPAYLGLQVLWRAQARHLARLELSGRRAEPYPARALGCGWVVLSAGAGDLRVHCVSSPFAKTLRPLLTVPVNDDSFIRASQSSKDSTRFF